MQSYSKSLATHARAMQAVAFAKAANARSKAANARSTEAQAAYAAASKAEFQAKFAEAVDFELRRAEWDGVTLTRQAAARRLISRGWGCNTMPPEDVCRESGDASAEAARLQALAAEAARLQALAAGTATTAKTLEDQALAAEAEAAPAAAGADSLPPPLIFLTPAALPRAPDFSLAAA